MPPGTLPPATGHGRNMAMTNNGNRQGNIASGSNVSRRGVLQGGSVLAAAAPPARKATRAQPVGPAMAALSSYMSVARERVLPADVIEKVKHHVLDMFA